MAEPRTDLPRQHPAANTLRIGFTVTAAASLVLGYVGFGIFLRDSTQYGNRPLDLLYYDVQLFVLGADPLQQAGPYPWPLEIARYAAPLATITALVEAARLLFAVELRRLRARRAHDHVIVCGDTPLAEILSRRLHASGNRVVQIRSQSGSVAPSPSYPLLVLGDGRDAGTLSAAGLHRATALYACTQESAANIAIGLTAGRGRRLRSPSLPIYTHVPDPDLCLTLQARYLGLPNPPGARLDFFNVDDLAARKLFMEEPLAPGDGPAPHLLVAGMTAFGRALIVEAARHWRRRPDSAPGSALHIALVAGDATETLGHLTHRYPFLRHACRLRAYDEDLVDLLVNGELNDPPDRAYICYEDEERALKTALTADRYWRGRRNSTVVRLDQLADFREDGGLASQLFDEGPTRLRVYGVLRAACDPMLIAEDLVERLARVIHDRYLAARHSHGDARMTSPSIVPWEDLSPELRQTNRAQAEDIGRKLRAIGCVLIPRMRQAEEDVMSEVEVERLAMMEHERWCMERLAAGWRFADRRDDRRKLHPALRDWSTLPADLRERNHDAVREVPLILADAGFQLVRV
ncbi:RyR domain-containing protein [Phytohabitans rumicis]|uniref:Uncharacterized protein n=1 Tax=Phytohabitans rumicis TaxID=1076125 RepID=A0A6V8LGC0_9ACTN|nr:RyR domain-containing protein [Phytohabitans rumicis]GFJ91675.1 hypothetical protein Prum_053170 [Phytohabitans rumicis]